MCGEQFDLQRSESNYFQMIVSPDALIRICDEEIATIMPKKSSYYSSYDKCKAIIGNFAKCIQADLVNYIVFNSL
jgi:hypothetical protein